MQLSAENVRAMSIEELRRDPALNEAWMRGWNDRGAGVIEALLCTTQPQRKRPRTSTSPILSSCSTNAPPDTTKSYPNTDPHAGVGPTVTAHAPPSPKGPCPPVVRPLPKPEEIPPLLPNWPTVTPHTPPSPRGPYPPVVRPLSKPEGIPPLLPNWPTVTPHTPPSPRGPYPPVVRPLSKSEGIPPLLPNWPKVKGKPTRENMPCLNSHTSHIAGKYRPSTSGGNSGTLPEQETPITPAATTERGRSKARSVKSFLRFKEFQARKKARKAEVRQSQHHLVKHSDTLKGTNTVPKLAPFTLTLSTSTYPEHMRQVQPSSSSTEEEPTFRTPPTSP